MIKILLNQKNTNISFKANPMPKAQAEYIDKKLQEADSVDIFCHVSTDEDAFNSAKAMYLYLESMGKNARIICSDNHALYDFDNLKYNIVSADMVDETTPISDLAICLDFSRKERLNPNEIDYLSKYQVGKVLGIDHHNESSYFSPLTRRITESYRSVSDMPEADPVNYYIDVSSKSCSAIIYRFFEALNKKMSDNQLVSLYCGMCDDMKKSGYISFSKGGTATFTKMAKDDSNTKHVFNKVKASLSEIEKKDIAKHLDIMSTLTKEEKKFQKRLFDSVKFSDNKKFAYCVIEPGDLEWDKLGGDNERTSSIIRDFRIRLLKNNTDDKLIAANLHSKLDRVKVAGIFYPDKRNGAYKVSLHSRADYVSQYIDYIRENLCSELLAGGHEDRGGGRIYSFDQDECNKFINQFVIASGNINYKSKLVG